MSPSVTPTIKQMKRAGSGIGYFDQGGIGLTTTAKNNKTRTRRALFFVDCDYFALRPTQTKPRHMTGASSSNRYLLGLSALGTLNVAWQAPVWAWLQAERFLPVCPVQTRFMLASTQAPSEV